MPRRPRDLPPELRGRAFGIHESALVTPSRLRASDLCIPARGTRLPATATGLQDRCAAHALTLPRGTVFSGLTAARLLGLPLPRWAQECVVLEVTVPRGVRAPRRRGVIAHQRAIAPTDIAHRFGLAVTSPVRTFVDLGSLLPLPALVAAGDRIISRRAPLATLEHLEAVVAASSARGSRRARAALRLLDPGSESPKETELRLLLLDAGFERFSANFEVFAPDGSFVARVDLAAVTELIALEYEGDHHRDPGQWRRDIARRRRLEALGWSYIPVTQADLTDPRALLADVHAAFGRRRSPRN